MGKKSKNKVLRRISNQLMPLTGKAYSVETNVPGYEILPEGVKWKEIDGVQIVADGTYQRKVPVEVPINHYRRMKKLRKQFGDDGVLQYVRAVQMHVEESKKKDQEQAEPEVLNSESNNIDN